MKSYTLTETRNQHGEVFDKAQLEPILVTKQKRPSHVIISAEIYQKLITRLEELEDLNLAKSAETALNQSSMVGSEEFTATLERIANG
ncbi:type II toxin-antitoxin system Phd/YefM family antitoxin [Geminocystis herdmanii]|uniref:type II toxin-antitoxin system Phd/YefM family antitoxin n=1 Tax=Geminocystis herdmanii TaxID=669359 RepID=UPI00034CD894|nr:type II toxin-antitoxin system Phd/YefM family antitoxin [Geminocystis herdmanii]